MALTVRHVVAPAMIGILAGRSARPIIGSRLSRHGIRSTIRSPRLSLMATRLDQDEIDRLRLLRTRAQAEGKVQDFGFRNHATAAYVEALLHLAPDLFDAAERSLRPTQLPTSIQEALNSGDGTYRP